MRSYLDLQGSCTVSVVRNVFDAGCISYDWVASHVKLTFLFEFVQVSWISCILIMIGIAWLFQRFFFGNNNSDATLIQ
jgi:hypothetical protein